MSDGGSDTVKNRHWIKAHLQDLPFVEWDRFTVGEDDGEQAVSVYGWIRREDEHEDFVVVTFWPESDGLAYTTSSSRRTEDIHRALVGDDLDGHNPCRRVEREFAIPNAVRQEEEMEGENA